MREASELSHEEYELMKIPLKRSEVPSDALAMLTSWIEIERLLVGDREDMGGIKFSRMDSKVVMPFPHIFASFFARRPYKRKAEVLPRLERLLYSPVSRYGGRLAADADTKELLLRL